MMPLGTGGRGSWVRRSGLEPAARLSCWALGALGRGLAGALGDFFLATQGDLQLRRRQRSAESARQLVTHLGALKGLFAKAGQFASLRLDLLPTEARRGFESLQQSVPPIPVEAIRKIVDNELPGPLESHFGSFDPEPLGAASIGQVHRATLLDATPVAVKVQYPWVSSSLRADLRLARAGLALFCWTTGHRIPDREKLFHEFSTSLATELDFEREARSAEEIAANLSGEAGVVVPAVFADHSTRRVLTMDYVATIPLEREVLVQRGIAPSAILEIVARAYAKQIFVDGLFHADPHPGNLFVLESDQATTSPQVVFVDFGLSKRLPAGLREAMRHGLFALIQRDAEDFVRHMDAMEMIAPGAHEGVQNAVEDMFERIRVAAQDPGNEHALGIAGQQVTGLKDQAKKLLDETPGLQLPNDLLLYAKTLSYLFTLGERLAPDVDLLKVSLPYVLHFLAGRT